MGLHHGMCKCLSELAAGVSLWAEATAPIHRYAKLCAAQPGPLPGQHSLALQQSGSLLQGARAIIERIGGVAGLAWPYLPSQQREGVKRCCSTHAAWSGLLFAASVTLRLPPAVREPDTMPHTPSHSRDWPPN